MKHLLTIVLAAISAFSFAQTTKTGDFHLDQNYKMKSTGTIYLNSSDADVYITGSSRSNAHVKINREVESKGLVFGEKEFSVDVEEEDGNLVIREREHSSSVGIVGYYHEKFTINIEAPEGASLRVRGDDGDYFIKTINGSIELDLDDADIELTGCKGNEFTFRLDDGDIKMDQGQGSLELDADDADVEITNARFTRISAEVDDGDFIVETTLTDGGDYFINGQDGLISLAITGGGGKFDVRHDDARVVADGSFSTVEESEDRTRLTLGSGGAKVDIRADDARVRLVKR